MHRLVAPSRHTADTRSAPVPALSSRTLPLQFQVCVLICRPTQSALQASEPYSASEDGPRLPGGDIFLDLHGWRCVVRDLGTRLRLVNGSPSQICRNSSPPDWSATGQRFVTGIGATGYGATGNGPMTPTTAARAFGASAGGLTPRFSTSLPNGCWTTAVR